MAPDAQDCDTVRLNVERVPVHHGRRILPNGQQPASAWTENEEERPGDNTNSLGENRRLLPTTAPPAKHKSRLQAGLTLGVHHKYPQITKTQKGFVKTKFEKRKHKLIALLKPPYFIVSMIIVLVLIHISLTEDMRQTLQWSPNVWCRQPWRLFTYGFAHANHAHLALNALVALAVGWPLEREQGPWRVAVLWCGGVAAGALGSGALQPHVQVVGASAAVYALLTAHISNVCLRFGHISLWWFRPLSVLVQVISELCCSLTHAPEPLGVPAAAHAHSYQDYVAWGTHIFGAAVGIPLAFIVFTGENNKKAYVIACRVVSGALLAAGAVAATVYYSWDADYT